MTYQPERELHLTYERQRGYFNFVLYSESPGKWSSAFNAEQQVQESASPYVQEWASRLHLTEPDALHLTLVRPDDAPQLWHPCVYDDRDSPSAIAGDGCVCWATSYDPLTWLPAVKHHFRTVTGNIEHWTYHTFSPLSLPAEEVLEKLIIDEKAKVMWMRTDRDNLHFLPEKQGEGYSVGYGGGGPHKFAQMIEKIVASDGRDVTPDTTGVAANSYLNAWVSSPATAHTQEVSLSQLRALRDTGRTPV